MQIGRMLASLLQQSCCELNDGKQFGNAGALGRRLMRESGDTAHGSVLCPAVFPLVMVQPFPLVMVQPFPLVIPVVHLWAAAASR